MNHIYTFHKTAIGHLHVLNGSVCEDASTSFSALNNKYYIAIVADGHGSKACFRSEYGSRVATEVALECLQQFANTILESDESEKIFYENIFFNPRYRKITLRRLIDIIVAKWHDQIRENYKDNPPTLEDMENIVEDDEMDVAHIYGTTIITALQLSECLILLQQGDGRCDVFFRNGNIEQPIPWDMRCEGTTTTSLCDENAAESFRTCVINLKETPLLACYLGSDGIEDAYRDTYEELGGSHILMGGVHTFYKDLTCQIASMGPEEFEKKAESMLSEFSANGRFSGSGSGDDVSVAGIVNLEAIQEWVERFQYDIKWYSLEEELFWKEDKLRSKSRKYNILKKRMKDAQEALERQRSAQKTAEVKLQVCKKKRDGLSKEIKPKEINLQELERYKKQNYILEIQQNDESLYHNSLLNGKDDKYLEKLNYWNNMKKLEKKRKDEVKKTQDMEKIFNEAKESFEKYDEKYQKIESERKCIIEKIAALLENNKDNIVNERCMVNISGK